MPDVELARRDGVELIRTGTWGASTGSWTPTKKDILAAVEAMKCPAVGKPILTIGHVDKRFTPRGAGHDGEPGIGWVDNLRAGEDGELLLGDYVGMPAWIDQVMASAWPKRSIEGKYNYRCALNHRHDFALDAVSLLGTTSPAIPTLRSLNDVAELYGVEIAASEDHSGDSVYAIVLASAEVHTGAMIALIPTVEDAERLAVEGGEPADQLHLTLAFLGEAAALGAGGKQDVIDHVSTVANGLPRLDAEIFSVNAFNPGDASERDTCLVWGVTSDLIDAVHDLVDETLHLIDAPIPSQHRPWAAHITAAYSSDLGRVAELAAKVGPVSFDRLRLAFGDEFIDIPLMEWPGEEADAPDAEAVAAASGDGDSLHDYWTKGPGLAKWRSKPHPWTALFNHLRKHLSADKAKRTASKWFLEVTGRTPNQKVKASGAGMVMAGRHSLPEFEEAKHKRANDGKFARKWNQALLKQDGKLGSRIQLGAGETLAGGAAVRPAGIVMAAIDAPEGRKLRVGLNIPDEDIDRWSGADKGYTAVLDQAGVDKFRAAIGRMQDGAKQGRELLKVFRKREADLHKQEQKLLMKQYPKLTSAQGKELGGVVRDITLGRDALDTYRGRQQERIAKIPDADARREAIAIDAEVNVARESGDSVAQADAVRRMQSLLKQHGEYQDTTAMMYGRHSGQIDDWHAEVARLEARRVELTANPVTLNGADWAELDQIRHDLARNDDMWGEFNDGSDLASGTIAGEWGDIRWETSMNSDSPSHRFAVVPKDAGPDSTFDGDYSEVEDADLRKLAALLDKAGADPNVRASSPPEISPPAETPAPILPAAEPEPVNTDPKEDLVSTDLSALRSRLGLDDAADMDAALAAVDALKAKADTPTEPTPEAVAASAAAEQEATELRTMVTKLTEQMTAISTELAAAKQEKADTVKASVLGEAKRLGKFTPADEPQWANDYDEAPGVTTRILASIAPGTAVPVMASGVTGPSEPEVDTDEFGVSEDSLSAWAKSLGIDEKELSRG
jgi:2'-5' RNA ligase